MAIYPTGSIEGIGKTSQLSSGADVIDKDEFMQLLITQLQNQDPLNPMENSEFTSQMADFASLEQLQNINGNLESLHLYQTALFNENVVSFIGNTVKAVDNTINLNNQVPDKLRFDLDYDASAIYVSIYNSSNELVRTIESTETFSAGEHNLVWDGNNDAGNQVPDGEYFYELRAVGFDGFNFSGTPFFEGVVNSVSFSTNGTAYLSTGDREIAVGNVIEVSGG